MIKIKQSVNWNWIYVRIEDMARQLTSTNYYLVTQKYPENKYYDFLGKNVYVYN